MNRVAAVALLAMVVLAAGARAAAPVSEETVHEVAAQLRCVVCHSISVADSPSETADQMGLYVTYDPQLRKWTYKSTYRIV
jgi:cytochrome c-type biogenesis protein CcmH/NrfF